MTEPLVVVLGDFVAGTVTRLAGGRLRFDYEDAYRCRADSTPLSVSMPVQVGSHADAVVSPWLWGLLPDNDAVLRRWARTSMLSASPFSLLATPVGHDCAGAVRFATPDAEEIRRAGVGRVAHGGGGRAAPSRTACGLHRMARRRFQRPIQSRRRPGQDRSSAPGRALGCAVRGERDHAISSSPPSPVSTSTISTSTVP